MPVVAAPAVAAPLPPRKAKGGILTTHGELSGASPVTPRPHTEDVPKVLVELAPDLQPEPELASSEYLEDLAPAAPPPLPPNEERPAPTTSLAEMPPTPEPGPTPPSAQQRPEGVHTAEIDTGMRPPPPPELLAAPSGGPSIMIDPGFSEEMDAFELAHSEPTPPPVTVVPPVAAAVVPAPPVEAPAAVAPPAAAADAPADPVVSFVRGVSAARSALAHTNFNAAPTVPVSALPPSARPATHAAPAPTDPTPPPVAAEAGPPASVVPAEAAPVPSPLPEPARSSERKERRASGEFDALESEFFAREADLYKRETVENFDDLDHGKKR
jgi:hypothetical protein